jgi:hypothetical protein
MDSSATSTSPSTSSDPTGDPTTDPTAQTETGSSTGPGDTSDSGESTAGDACEAGDMMACDCGDGPGYAACTDTGQFGPCECCEGTHPLLEGDLRYCDEGVCYCGDLDMEPPIDVCYEQAIADACCPVDLECY